MNLGSEIAIIEVLALKAEKNQSWKGELKRKYKIAIKKNC